MVTIEAIVNTRDCGTPHEDHYPKIVQLVAELLDPGAMVGYDMVSEDMTLGRSV